MKRIRILHAVAAAMVLPAALLHAQMGSGSGEAPQTAFGAGRMVQGTVTAVAPDGVTLKTETGEVYKVAVTPNTQVRKDRAQVKLGEVHPGDGVGAMGELDRPNHTVHALMLYVVDAAEIKKARENMGKTYIAGKVTAIAMDDLKLTILRSDGVTQVITVDEGTSFKRGGRGMQQAMNFGFGGGGIGPSGAGQGGGRGGGYGGGQGGSGGQSGQVGQGESITLGDIKVGDLVGGPGTLKSGVFTPTELSVGTPGARGGGRRRRGEAAAGGGAANAGSVPGTNPQGPQ